MAHQNPHFQHPTIGSLRGTRRFSSVDQFLGLQFAKLADRFSRGVLIEEYPDSTDATAYGPLPVGNPKACDIEHLLLQHALPHPEYSFSETECLRLNVSLPSAEARGRAGGLLPVVVYTHGGGFATGSAHWPQWDLAALVESSVALRAPIVAVGISYRIGVFGFLTSDAMRKAGYLPNNGLHDQKLALRWIQKNIAGFGGDPAKVTFLGTSIGGASGFIHLQSEEPLFNQLAALCGSAVISPIPPHVAEIAFASVTKGLGIEKLSPSDQVKALLEMPAAELQAKTADVPAPITMVVDNDVVKGVTTYDILSKPQEVARLFPGTHWCKTIMSGDCQLDAMVFAVSALRTRTDNLAATLERCLATALGQDSSSPTVSAIISAYGVNPHTAEGKTDLMPVLNFLTDISFCQGAKACARAWFQASPTHDTRAFLVHFNSPNPWPGAYQGYATHCLDSLFLLQNYNAYLPDGQRACAERLARDIILFVNGRQPFPPLDENDAAMVYYAGSENDNADESQFVTNGANVEKTGRRDTLEKIAAGKPEILDKMMDALMMLLAGPQ